VLNPYTVFDTVDYFSQLGYQENSFVIGPITSPVDFDVRNLPDSILEELGNILDYRIQSTNSPVYVAKLTGAFEHWSFDIA